VTKGGPACAELIANKHAAPAKAASSFIFVWLPPNEF